MTSCSHNPGALAHYLAEDLDRVDRHLDEAQHGLDGMRETLGGRRRRALAMTEDDLTRGSPRRAEPAKAGEIRAVVGELRAAHGLLAALADTVDAIRAETGTDYGAGEITTVIAERVAAAVARLDDLDRST